MKLFRYCMQRTNKDGLGWVFFPLLFFFLFSWKNCRKLGWMVFLNVSHWLIKCAIIGVTCTLKLSKLCSLPLIQVQIGIWLHSVEIKWLRLQGSHFTYIYEVCDNSPQRQKLARIETFNLVSLFLSPPPLLMLNKFSRREVHMLYSQECYFKKCTTCIFLLWINYSWTIY